MRRYALAVVTLPLLTLAGHAAPDSHATQACDTTDASRAPAVITGFDGYTAVNLCDYAGPKHYGWSSYRFTTAEGVHCELYDGPNSWQYYSSITCWGKLPGVPADVTQVEVAAGSVATYGQADVRQKETQDGGVPVDPAGYRQLAPGQKIVVPGAKGSLDENDEVCATAGDGALTCEIQNPGEAWGQDRATHGFVLSVQGSRIYRTVSQRVSPQLPCGTCGLK